MASKFYRKFFIIILLIASYFSKSFITELDNDNYLDFIKNNPIIILNLCREKNSICDKFSIEFEEAARRANNSNYDVKFAHLDVSKYEKLSRNWVYDKVPTVYFVNREDNDHEVLSGKKTSDKIYDYLKKKLDLNLEFVGYTTDLLNSMKMNKITKTILYAYNSLDILLHSVIAKASKLAGIKKAFITNSKEFLSIYNITDFDLLYIKEKNNSLNGERMFLNELNDKHNIIDNKTEIQNLITIYSRKLLEKVEEKDMTISIENGFPTVFLIHNETDYNLIENIKSLASKYRKDFFFLLCPFKKNKVTNHLVKYFKISRKDLIKGPLLILTARNKYTDDDLEKYVFPKQLQLNNTTVENFLLDFKNDRSKLSRIVYSENLENFTKSNSIKKLTGNNFAAMINKTLAENQTVIVLICPALTKKYDRIIVRMNRVIKKLNLNRNLQFFQIDPFLNELDYIKYKYIPSIAVIKNSNWKYKILHDVLTTANMVQFIKNNTVINSDEKLSQEQLINLQELNWPLDAIKKSKFENKLWSNTEFNITKMNTGLKRSWKYSEFINDQKMINDLLNTIKAKDEAEKDVDEIDENDYLKQNEL